MQPTTSIGVKRLNDRITNAALMSHDGGVLSSTTDGRAYAGQRLQENVEKQADASQSLPLRHCCNAATGGGVANWTMLLLNSSHQSCDQSCFQWRCCKMACGAVTFFPAIREGYSCICLKASFSSHSDEPAQLLPALRPLSAEGTHSDHFSMHVQLPAQAEKGLLWSICLPPPRRNATNHVNWCKATERPHHKCCAHES